MLSQQDKTALINKAENTLAKMWLLLLYDVLNISPQEFLTLINKYQETVAPSSSVKTRNSFKSNLLTQLMDSKLTWKGFMKALAVCQFYKMTITIELEKHPDAVTIDDKYVTGKDNVILNFTTFINKSGIEGSTEE
jgi:hypothetical protein